MSPLPFPQLTLTFIPSPSRTYPAPFPCRGQAAAMATKQQKAKLAPVVEVAAELLHEEAEAIPRDEVAMTPKERLTVSERRTRLRSRLECFPSCALFSYSPSFLYSYFLFSLSLCSSFVRSLLLALLLCSFSLCFL